MSTVTRKENAMQLLNSGQYERIAELVRTAMPPHTAYCEPYFLEGEVLFSKYPSAVEIINDNNDDVISFYMTVRTQWKEFAFLLESTLYADTLYRLADRIAEGTLQTDAVYRAWSFWLRYNRNRTVKDAWMKQTSAWMDGIRTVESPNGFVRMVAKRMENLFILNREPLEVIKEYDNVDTFFYLHPHTRKQVNGLEKCLSDIKGQFIFHYPDKRVGERVAAKFHLNKETDAWGNTVYMNFKRQKSLFENE